MNSNGEHLLKMCNRQSLIPANTTFAHKKAHRATWVCPEKQTNNRKIPVRNQIDYIIMMIDQYRIFAQDDRSYPGTNTNNDHRLAMLKMKMNRHKMTPSKINKHKNTSKN